MRALLALSCFHNCDLILYITFGLALAMTHFVLVLQAIIMFPNAIYMTPATLHSIIGLILDRQYRDDMHTESGTSLLSPMAGLTNLRALQIRFQYC